MLQAIRRVLFWTYERGSWQYDILCAVILCFIFLTPKTVFDGTAFLHDPGDGVPSKEERPLEEKQASHSTPTDQTEGEPEEGESLAARVR